MAKEPWLKFGRTELLDEDLLLERPSVDEQLEADWSMLRGKEPPLPEGTIPRMTDARLKEFILGVLDGSLFTSRHIQQHTEGTCPVCKEVAPVRNPRVEDRCFQCEGPLHITSRPNIDYGMVFLPLALGGLSSIAKEELANIGGLWAPYTDAFPRSINGYPIFKSVGVVHVLDWEKAWGVIDREMHRRETLDLNNI